MKLLDPLIWCTHLLMMTSRIVQAVGCCRNKMLFNVRLCLLDATVLLNNKNIHGPNYKKRAHVLLHYPVLPVGRDPIFSNPWRGAYCTLKCFIDLYYQVRELRSSKVQAVPYDRLKRYQGPILTVSDIQIRTTNRPTPTCSQAPQVAAFDHSQDGHFFKLSIFPHK